MKTSKSQKHNMRQKNSNKKIIENEMDLIFYVGGNNSKIYKTKMWIVTLNQELAFS
jgi:hypothetical protein